MNDLGATLTYAHVRPFEVKEVVAGWESFGNGTAESGFVVRMLDGEYAYVVSARDARLKSIKAFTQYFSKEPTHLYRRARRWNHNKEELNATLPWAKTEAKYPSPDREGRDSANPLNMGRTHPRPSSA